MVFPASFGGRMQRSDRKGAIGKRIIYLEDL